MSAHLRVIDAEGEVLEGGCPDCEALEDQLAGLERDVRGWRIRYAQLKRDAEAAAKNSDHWQPLEELFGEWREATGHKRSPFTVDRFEVALPFYLNAKYGPEVIKVGIAGIAFDHFSKPQKNGRVEHYDGWHHLFKSADTFERFVNRAPLPKPKAEGPPSEWRAVVEGERS